MTDRIRTRTEAGREDGFTLIELLIVIVILGILAGIVVFSVSGITDRGKNSACSADLKTVQVASEAYFAKTSSYAATIGDLSPSFLQSVPTDVAYTAGTGGAAPTIAKGTGC